MSPELEDLRTMKENLFKLRIEQATNHKSNPFSRENLVKVLKSLKGKKARDPFGLIYEIFKPEMAGEDLINSLLLLFNGMKDNLHIPGFLTLANITSLYKNKGDRLTEPLFESHFSDTYIHII